MVNNLDALEGDFIESKDSLIFDVKGLIHPPNKVIAFLRYVPSSSGDRIRNNIKFMKLYLLHDRFNFLRSHYPQYLYYDPIFNIELQAVPKTLIKKHYKPRERLSQMVKEKEALDEVELSALQLAEELSSISDLSLNNFGISGSILVKLHKPNSDIDLIVYGSKNCIKFYNSIKENINRLKRIKKYDIEGLIKLYKFRVKDTHLPLKTFIKIESRKVLQGRFMNKDYYIRLIKDLNELNEHYGDSIYMSIGRARIKAKVIDDSNSIFSPCRYIIDDVSILSGVNVPISEIFSFRGRFCECAFKNEIIIAEGKVEKVLRKDGSTYYRLILGENPMDFIVPTNI